MTTQRPVVMLSRTLYTNDCTAVLANMKTVPCCNSKNLNELYQNDCINMVDKIL